MSSLLYTPMPEHALYDHSVEPKQLHEIHLEGNTILQTEKLEEGYKVVRVISSDCQNYLNPLFQPGSIINFKG
ncbi:YlzJ-like family protein [Proteinivorax hydrogeniformans]|uniref:YlzJ-like family protein n=1 Tax=Proteinivorax hydrogeniformans TaxID=1826727 RepID=A0AAU8HQP4_9FIRM